MLNLAGRKYILKRKEILCLSAFKLDHVQFQDDKLTSVIENVYFSPCLTLPVKYDKEEMWLLLYDLSLERHQMLQVGGILKQPSGLCVEMRDCGPEVRYTAQSHVTSGWRILEDSLLLLFFLSFFLNLCTS